MKKRIALLGNMNNNFNSTCRYLLDYGFDAKLFTFDYENLPHFRPSADCYDDRWKAYTHELSWGSAKTFVGLSKKYLTDFFQEFDILIGAGYAPAFVQKAERKLDIFAPHGSDINHLPYLEKYSAKDIGRYLFVGRNQRKGIVNARYVFSDRWTEDLETKIDKLKLEGKRQYTIIPFLYTPQYLGMKIDPVEPQIAAMVNIKSNSDLVIFHHIRHSWVHPSDKIAMKSNNFLFEGVADFINKNPGVRISIVTFEYGEDVTNTKKLIRELEIEGSVFWFPITPRKIIMKMMSMADVVTGEFNYSFVSYGAILEGMAMSKPIMHRRDDHLYSKTHQNLYPMIHVESSGDIQKGVLELLKNPRRYLEMGMASNEWMKKNMIDDPMQEIVKVINSSR